MWAAWQLLIDVEIKIAGYTRDVAFHLIGRPTTPVIQVRFWHLAEIDHTLIVGY